MAKKPRPEGKKYNFMDTYGDLVTLLMCFFVLLFAMSSVDEAKYNAFVNALSSRFGPTPANLSTVAPNEEEVEGDDYGNEEVDPTGDTAMPVDQTMPTEFSQLAEAIERYVAENDMAADVQLEVGESGAVFIRLSHSLLFSGNSSVLSSEVVPFLDFLGECFTAVDQQVFQVQFLGHTASIAGSNTDDRMLSAERGGRVASYFERTVGFSPYKLRATGFGRHYPIADNANDTTRALNRRVDVIVIGNDPNTLMAALAEANRVYFPGDDTQFFEGSPEELPDSALAAAEPMDGVDLENLTDEEMDALQGVIDAQRSGSR